ncbi:MAG: hypothetical protein MUF54_13160 [Polyangiaceae bacterium]|nr:hypothetical protein [Polyangiaceae bacterium]
MRAPKRLSIRKEGYVLRTIKQGPSTVDVQQALAIVASRDAKVERPKLLALRRLTKAKSAPTEPALPVSEIGVVR